MHSFSRSASSRAHASLFRVRNMRGQGGRSLFRSNFGLPCAAASLSKSQPRSEQRKRRGNRVETSRKPPSRPSRCQLKERPVKPSCTPPPLIFIRFRAPFCLPAARFDAFFDRKLSGPAATQKHATSLFRRQRDKIISVSALIDRPSTDSMPDISWTDGREGNGS